MKDVKTITKLVHFENTPAKTLAKVYGTKAMSFYAMRRV